MTPRGRSRAPDPAWGRAGAAATAGGARVSPGGRSPPEPAAALRGEGFPELLRRLARCHEERVAEALDLRRQVARLSGEVFGLRSALMEERRRSPLQLDGQLVEEQMPEQPAPSKHEPLPGDSGDVCENELTGGVVHPERTGPAWRWGVLAGGLLEMAGADSGGFGSDGRCRSGKEAPTLFVLLPHWSLNLESREDCTESSAFGMVTLHSVKRPPMDKADTLWWHKPLNRLEGLVVSPSSYKRLLWSLIGVVLLTWDALFIPMQVFTLGEFGEILGTFALITTAYWLIDMPFQCFIALQYSDGTEERRPVSIMRHYLRTWMPIDAAIVLIDVVLFVLDRAFEDSDEEEALQAGRSMRLARLLRLLRLLRLMRMRKLNEFLAVAVIRVRSEHMILGLRLAKHVAMILLVNHYIACGWYALASATEGVSWLNVYATQDPSTPHVYAMALHWSMTQFSPATNNIAPTNWHERMFAVCVVLFALISFSSFISSVTNTVNQLRTLNLEPQMEEARIREFLFARKASPELMARILRFFKQNYKMRHKRIHEDDIPFFGDVPESMKIMMHQEAYMPILLASSMFAPFVDLTGSLFVEVCHTAFSEVFFLPQQDVFVDGTPSTGVHFISSGRLLYKDSASLEGARVEPSDWVSELCLWVQWDHRGQLSAESSSEIVTLNSVRFNAIVSRAHGPFMECLRRYAVFILGHIEALPRSEVTDLSLGADILAELGGRARRIWELQSRGRTHNGILTTPPGQDSGIKPTMDLL